MPVAPGNRFGLYAEARPGLDTGVALYREDPLPINLRLHAADGTELETSSWDFSEKKSAKFLTELFPNLSIPFEGFLEVESESLLVPLALRVDKGILSTLPVIPIIADVGGTAPIMNVEVLEDTVVIDQFGPFVRISGAVRNNDFQDAVSNRSSY